MQVVIEKKVSVLWPDGSTLIVGPDINDPNGRDIGLMRHGEKTVTLEPQPLARLKIKGPEGHEMAISHITPYSVIACHGSPGCTIIPVGNPPRTYIKICSPGSPPC